MKLLKVFLPAIMAFLIAGPVMAIGVDQPLSDPAAEERARELFAEFRCLVCQNQSIEDSQADLAKDLRFLVRERIEAGDNDQEIRDFLVERYGDWVLLEPPLRMRTLLLWGGPALFFVLAGFVGWRMTRKNQVAAAANNPEAAPAVSALSDAERKELNDILRAQEEGTN